MVTDNEVFTILTLNTDDHNHNHDGTVDRIVAGMQSAPIAVDISALEQIINVGDVWDGTSFTPSVG